MDLVQRTVRRLFSAFQINDASNVISLLIQYRPNGGSGLHLNQNQISLIIWEVLLCHQVKFIGHILLTLDLALVFVTGGTSKATELLSLSKRKWRTSIPYPNSVQFYSAASVFYANEFYVFGGTSITKTESRIMKFSPMKDSWSNSGSLISARHDHSVILIKDRVYIIGGKGYFISEVCSLTSKKCSHIGSLVLEKSVKPHLLGYNFQRKRCGILENHKVHIKGTKSYKDAIFVLHPVDTDRNRFHNRNLKILSCL